MGLPSSFLFGHFSSFFPTETIMVGNDGGSEVSFEQWLLHATKKELKLCCRNWKGKCFWQQLRHAVVDHGFRSEGLRSDPEVSRIFESLYANGLCKSGRVVELIIEDDFLL